MRIAEYKQIDTEIVKEIIHHDGIIGENGEVIDTAWDEEVTKEIPKMGMVYRDATPEEEAEFLRQQKEMEEYERNRPLTPEERMEILEDAFAELCEVIL